MSHERDPVDEDKTPKPDDPADDGGRMGYHLDDYVGCYRNALVWLVAAQPLLGGRLIRV